MRALCISLVMALSAASSASAQPATSPQSPEALAKVYACALVSDPQQRLACFDAAVAGMRTAETTGEFAAVDAGRVREIQKESFGFSLPSLPRLGLPGTRRADGTEVADAPNSQTMKIVRLGRMDGNTTFIMDNGQVWAVIVTQENRYARPGATVTVRKASIGSFLLSPEAGGSALRVRRVQ
jgi:hypothetical protein